MARYTFSEDLPELKAVHREDQVDYIDTDMIGRYHRGPRRWRTTITLDDTEVSIPD